MLTLKQRIFGSKFSLEEILESLVTKEIVVFKPVEQEKPSLLSTLNQNFEIILDASERVQPPEFLLYESADDKYEVYGQVKTSNHNGLYVPTGVTVQRVPQHILGTGVLGRAYIHNNYIEILDSLFGVEYTEVLTHEILHIMYPEKSEIDIRMITRNYVGHTLYN